MRQVSHIGASDLGQPLVSIIVPVYNVEKYLEECLDSILNQDVKGYFEVIMVNDCSSDDSHYICKKYTDKFPSIFKYIEHKSNQGVSVARNTGVDNACGEYFMFVDSDDYMPSGAVTALLNAAIQFDADIVKGNHLIVNDGGVKKTSMNVARSKYFSGHAVFSELLKHKNVRGYPWGKLFLREPFNDVRFRRGSKMAEDLSYCAEIFSRAKKMVMVNEAVYFYRQHAQSATSNKYCNDVYKQWFESVEKLSNFVVTKEHDNFLLQYKIRVLNQLIKEARKLSIAIALPVIQNIVEKERDWCVGWAVLIRCNPDIKTLWRYCMYKFYMAKI